MVVNSLEIKNKTNSDLDNICYIDDFDVNSLKKNQELVLILIILDVLLI